MLRTLDPDLQFVRDRRKAIKDVDPKQAGEVARAIRKHLKDELDVTEEDLERYLTVASVKTNEGLEEIGAATKAAAKTAKKRKINEVTTSSCSLEQNLVFQEGMKAMRRKRRKYDEEEKKNLRTLYYKTKATISSQSQVGFNEEFVRSLKSRNDYATFSVTELKRILSDEDGM